MFSLSGWMWADNKETPLFLLMVSLLMIPDVK